MPDIFTVIHEAVGTIGIILILSGAIVGLFTLRQPEKDSRFY